MYRILSLDGGGIRGAFTARVLERLEERVPGFLESVNLFAGTSSGGLLALGLAMGLSPKVMVQFFEQHGPRIFSDPWREFPPWETAFLRSRYDDARRHESLKAIFGERTLHELPRPVLVSSFDLDDGADPDRDPDKLPSWKPKFFHNYTGDPGTDANELVVDVAMRTSAAPTYFPSWQGFVDGGVIANNPSVAALAQALDPRTGGQTIGQCALLSIGTGRNPRRITDTRTDWGLIGWAPHLVDMLIEGAMDTARYQCDRLLGDRFRRVDVPLDQPIALDDHRVIPAMIGLGSTLDINEVVLWLTGPDWADS